MVLYFSVFITNKRWIWPHRHHHFPTDDRLNVFKYSLASCFTFEPFISKCILYIELDDDFKDRKLELEEFIYQNFPKEKVTINWFRNVYTSDWRKSYEKDINDDDKIIWCTTNDDHIFIDNSLDVVQDGIKLLEKEEDIMSYYYYSHWFEIIRIADYFKGTLDENKHNIKFRGFNTACSIMAMKRERFKSYWFDYDFKDTVVTRLDLLSHLIPMHETTVFAPSKEIFRHIDAYPHVGGFYNNFPPLMIPEGFFNNDIKIRYGYNDRKPGWTTFNPTADLLFGHSPEGIDYRWTLDEIPLFWKNKITDIDINPNYILDKDKRNNYLIESTRLIEHSYHFQFETNPPIEWFKKYLL